MRTEIVARILASVVMALMLPGTAAAHDYVIGPDTVVSGPSTLTSCPAGASPDFAQAYNNTEVEPQVAVNPTNPNEIVGASQQDRWPDGGARGLTAWRSTTGGTSWAQLPDAPWSACQSGPTRFGRVTDPWVSYDKAGNLYFLGQPIDSAELGISAVAVATWDGTKWQGPRLLIEDRGDRGVFNDKVSITGDPTRAGHAYATWIRGDYPPGQRQSRIADFHSLAYRGQPMFSRTTDGGRHWSGPTVVSTGGPNVQAYNHAIEVTANGTVVLTYYDDRNNVLGDGIATTDIWLRHSHDGGRTWEPEQHLYGPFDHYKAPTSFIAPGEPRGLFLGDYVGLETITGNSVITFFPSTVPDGATIHSIRATHP
jgi:hypothetical protein